MLNIGLDHAVVGSCEVKIIIRVGRKSQFLRKRLLTEKNKVVLPYFEVIIPLLPVSFLDIKDFSFHPIAQFNLIFFVYIMYHKTTKVLVRNTFNQSLCILCRQRLSYIVDIYYNNCFLANAKSTFDLATVLPQTALLFVYKLSYTLISIDLSMETRLDNEVKVYGDKYIVILLD